MFSWRFSIQEMALTEGLFGSLLLQILLDFAKGLNRGSFKFTSLLLDSSKAKPKFTVLVYFWAQFFPGKPKILPKPKVFEKLNP